MNTRQGAAQHPFVTPRAHRGLGLHGEWRPPSPPLLSLFLSLCFPPLSPPSSFISKANEDPITYIFI